MDNFNHNGLKQHIGYWIDRLRGQVHHTFEARLASHNITVASWCIMVAIYDKKANSVNELARYIEVDKATISRVVEKLLVKELITHKPGKDRRSGVIELTSKGKKIIPLLMKEADLNEQQFFGHLTEAQKSQLQDILYSLMINIPSITVDGWLINKKSTGTIMKNIEQILIDGRTDQQPFPKTFYDLKKVGVTSYTISFINEYQGIFEGAFGIWKEPIPSEYHPLDITPHFSSENIKNAVIARAHKRLDFLGFLQEIAANGVSHYKVDMNKYTVTYFNSDESQSHRETVPIWDESVYETHSI